MITVRAFMQSTEDPSLEFIYSVTSDNVEECFNDIYGNISRATIVKLEIINEDTGGIDVFDIEQFES